MHGMQRSASFCEYSPISHMLHLLAPGSEWVPSLHTAHDMAPLYGAKRPDLHDMHGYGCPRRLPKRPGMQDVQSLAPGTDASPAAQNKHAGIPLPGWNLPPGHGTQPFFPSEKWPEAHGMIGPVEPTACTSNASAQSARGAPSRPPDMPLTTTRCPHNQTVPTKRARPENDRSETNGSDPKNVRESPAFSLLKPSMRWCW